MDNIQTMNLMNNSEDSGMVSIQNSHPSDPPKPSDHPRQQPPQPPQQQPPPPPPPLQNELKNAEKNISYDNKEQKMDSTPLDEVMGMNDPAQFQAQPPQDPRVIQPPVQAVPQLQQIPVAPGQQPQDLQKAQPESKKFMNLTTEQIEALMVGFICVLAFSRPLQEKLVQIVPQFLNENGSKSTVGLAITGLIAAVLFFFGRKFLMKN